MVLGSSPFAPSRFFSRRIAVFVQWESEAVLNDYLLKTSKGKHLSNGWHIRLKFIRQWGSISGFSIPSSENCEIEGPVVAVTLARMRFFQIPRFLKWGRPVERLVRDHPGKNLSLASMRLPNLISTFSIWKNQQEMSSMVFGHSKVEKPTRHIDAMKERDRKDFHFEFTTLRFIPLGEFGDWNGESSFLKN